MAQPNAAWLFYKDYYRDINFARTDLKNSRVKEDDGVAFEQSNARLLSVTLPEKAHDPIGEHLDGTRAFDLTTTYPGLLLGSGYQHETGRQGEWKLGFFFDHTTGLPIIPGSSIKGMLRSCFKTPEMIRHFLDDPELDVAGLEEDIFSGKDRSHKNPATFVPRPMSQHDVFFDAFPVDTENGRDRTLFAPDVLTPHNPTDSKFGPFKEPIPIAFMKVKPGIVYRFRFKLNDTSLATAHQKWKLFFQLIEMFGLGAKTNVGYGHFTGQLEGEPGVGTSGTSTKEPATPARPTGDLDNLEDQNYSSLKSAYRSAKPIQAIVRDNSDKTLTVVYKYNGEARESKISYPASDKIPINALIKLKVRDAGKPDKGIEPVFAFAGFAK